MSTSWYAKLDASFHSNRKARKAGRIGRELFLFVLCRNADRGGTGDIPAADLELDYVAEQLQMTEAEAEEGIKRAIEAKLIVIRKDRVQIVGWNDDWAKRPMTEAERQQKRRDKVAKPQANGNTQHNGHVTNHETSVTRHETNVTNHGQRDASRREVGRKEGREGERKGPGNNRAVARALSQDFVPDSQAQSIASERGLDVDRELAKFRNWAAAEGKTKRDWDAAFRKWLQDARPSEPASTGSGPNDIRRAASPPAGPIVSYRPSAIHRGLYLELVDGQESRVVERLPDGTYREVKAA